MMPKPNCKDCRYRYWLAKECDTHVWWTDCDKCGTEFCENMNDPEFIEFMNEKADE